MRTFSQSSRAVRVPPLIELALGAQPPLELETGSVLVGFARTAVLDNAGAVLEAVQSGALRRFVVMAGCDGRHKERAYYTDVARALPQDTIILTAGCAKYRYNKLGLGTIGGLPPATCSPVVEVGTRLSVCTDIRALFHNCLYIQTAVLYFTIVCMYRQLW